MSNGHSVIPIDEEQFGTDGIVKYLEKVLVFVPENIPRGRFPTLAELRLSIQELGYELEEGYDWYVTSKDDFTEIWFKGENREENTPSEFWFQRGSLIVLNISQSLANRYGGLVVWSHSGSPTILFVPEAVFSSDTTSPTETDYFKVIAHRLPIMFERLSAASTKEILFLLSQIREAIHDADRADQHEFFNAVQQGLTTYKKLLDHEDTRIRYMAFDLITIFRERFFETSEALKSSILREHDSVTKTRMIYELERLIVPGWIGGEIYQSTKAILDVLSELNNNDKEPGLVRLAAAHILARAQPGLLTPAIRDVLINSLVHPEPYDMSKHSGYSAIDQVLKSIEKMLLNHRIDILVSALPDMNTAQYAHQVLRALLDHVFFGTVHRTQMSSLPDDRLAERPKIDEIKFDKNGSRSWLYPTNPTNLRAEELLPTQRKVLETVIALDIPWMVHSNLLEKYGLPSTRTLVRAFLDTNQ